MAKRVTEFRVPDTHSAVVKWVEGKLNKASARTTLKNHQIWQKYEEKSWSTCLQPIFRLITGTRRSARTIYHIFGNITHGLYIYLVVIWSAGLKWLERWIWILFHLFHSEKRPVNELFRRPAFLRTRTDFVFRKI